MSALSIVLVIFEIVIAFGIVWALLNEDFFIRFENRVMERIVSYFKNRRKPSPPRPTAPQMTLITNNDDDEFARFAPFVA